MLTSVLSKTDVKSIFSSSMVTLICYILLQTNGEDKFRTKVQNSHLHQLVHHQNS